MQYFIDYNDDALAVELPVWLAVRFAYKALEEFREGRLSIVRHGDLEVMATWVYGPRAEVWRLTYYSVGDPDLLNLIRFRQAENRKARHRLRYERAKALRNSKSGPKIPSRTTCCRCSALSKRWWRGQSFCSRHFKEVRQ